MLFIYQLEPRIDDWMKDVDARVQFGIDFGKSRDFIRSGDPIVIVTGWKSGSGYTNTMRVVYVGNPTYIEPVVVPPPKKDWAPALLC